MKNKLRTIVGGRVELSPQNERRLERYANGGRIFMSNTFAMIGLLVIIGFVLLAIFAPYIAPYEMNENVESDSGSITLQPPSNEHPFGTTQFAKDVFSQWVWGTRISIMVGLLSGLVVMLVGTTVGLIAGYYRGTVDMVLMRFVDVLYGLPAVPFILVLALFIGATVWNVILAMLLVLWRTMSRVIRSQTLSLAQRPYVKAARATGASDMRIMAYYLIPNLLPIMLIETTIVASRAIVLEAGVSFLGLGTTEAVSWGTMLQASFSTGAIREAWWWVFPPGLSIAMIVVSLFYISRGLEEVTNPELTSEMR